MDSKKRKVDEETQKPETGSESGKSFAVLRKSVERIGFEELIDFITLFSLEKDNEKFLKAIMEKINQKKELRKVFVRSIGFNTKEKDFKAAMEKYGKLEECLMVMDPETKTPKGFAFVTYADYSGAMNALKEGKVTIGDRTAYVHFAEYNYRSEKRKSPKFANANSNGNGQNYDIVTSEMDKRREHQIFIRNLGDEIDAETLKDVFKQYGPIEECFVPKDRETGRQKGYGFVKYYSPDSVNRCLKEPNKVINGITIKCDFSSRRKKTLSHQSQYQNPANYNPMYSQPPQIQQTLPPQHQTLQAPIAQEIQRHLEQLQFQQQQLVQKVNASALQSNSQNYEQPSYDAQTAYSPQNAVQGYYSGPTNRGNYAAAKRSGDGEVTTGMKREAKYYGGPVQNQ